MPAEFSAFWFFDLKTRTLKEADHTAGETPAPLIFATRDGRHAMGILAPTNPKPSFGRFDFPGAKVTKWNCVYRVNNPAGLPPTGYDYRMFVIVGTRDEVRATLAALSQTF